MYSENRQLESGRIDIGEYSIPSIILGVSLPRCGEVVITWKGKPPLGRIIPSPTTPSTPSSVHQQHVKPRKIRLSINVSRSSPLQPSLDYWIPVVFLDSFLGCSPHPRTPLNDVPLFCRTRKFCDTVITTATWQLGSPQVVRKICIPRMKV